MSFGLEIGALEMFVRVRLRNRVVMLRQDLIMFVEWLSGFLYISYSFENLSPVGL